MKCCTKCLQDKPFTDFARCSEAKDGYQWQCKACKQAWAAQRSVLPSDDDALREKQCSGCLALKPLTGFHKNRRQKDGRSSQCKDCACARTIYHVRSRTPSQQEEAQRYGQEYYRENITRWKLRYQAEKQDPSAQEANTIRKRIYYQSNRTKMLQDARARQIRNVRHNAVLERPYPAQRLCRDCGETKPGLEFYRNNTRKDGFSPYCIACVSATRTTWNINNPLKVRAAHARYQARKRGAKLGQPPLDIAEIIERDEGICHLCGDPIDDDKWTLDHLIPISKGGIHAKNNVALAHLSCNSRRQNRAIPACSPFAYLNAQFIEEEVLPIPLSG